MVNKITFCFPQVSRLNEDRRHKTWTCCSSLLKEHVSYSLKVNMCIWGDIVGTPFKKRQEQTAETAFLKHLAAFGLLGSLWFGVDMRRPK